MRWQYAQCNVVAIRGTKRSHLIQPKTVLTSPQWGVTTIFGDVSSTPKDAKDVVQIVCIASLHDNKRG